jgi:hypothetical protein
VTEAASTAEDEGGIQSSSSLRRRVVLGFLGEGFLSPSFSNIYIIRWRWETGDDEQQDDDVHPITQRHLFTVVYRLDARFTRLELLNSAFAVSTTASRAGSPSCS